MRKVLRYPAVRFICWYLAFTLSGLFLLPPAANAAFISTSKGTLAALDADALTNMKTALERGVLEEKLANLGLSAGEISKRLDAMSAEERQAVLEDVNRIQAGGDGIVTLLIVVLLVVLILKLMDKEIIIK